MLVTSAGCAAGQGPIGFTLQYRCFGDYSIGVRREQFEGQAMTYGPGSLGCIKPGTPENSPRFTWAQMSYMPGDVKGGPPTWVEFDWMVATPEYKRKGEELTQRHDKYSARWNADMDALNESALHYSQRIDLRSVVTPELLAQVRANRQTTQLKITFTFEGDKVSAKAEAFKWR
jgi:hypothetical protein